MISRMNTSHSSSRAPSRGFIGIVLIIVIGLAALGGGGWYVSTQGLMYKQASDDTTPTVNGAKQAPGSPVGIQILSVDNQGEGKLPIIRYEISGTWPDVRDPSARLQLSLFGRSGFVGEVWETEITTSGTGAIDLNTSMHKNMPVKIVPGNYYLSLTSFHPNEGLAGSSLLADSDTFSLGEE